MQLFDQMFIFFFMFVFIVLFLYLRGIISKRGATVGSKLFSEFSCIVVAIFLLFFFTVFSVFIKTTLFFGHFFFNSTAIHIFRFNALLLLFLFYCAAEHGGASARRSRALFAGIFLFYAMCFIWFINTIIALFFVMEISGAALYLFIFLPSAVGGRAFSQLCGAGSLFWVSFFSTALFFLVIYNCIVNTFSINSTAIMAVLLCQRAGDTAGDAVVPAVIAFVIYFCMKLGVGPFLF